jgi:hypothetical protein
MRVIPFAIALQPSVVFKGMFRYIFSNLCNLNDWPAGCRTVDCD